MDEQNANEKEKLIEEVCSYIKVASYQKDQAKADHYLELLHTLEKGTARVLEAEILTEVTLTPTAIYATLPAVAEFEKVATTKEIADLSCWLQPKMQADRESLERHLNEILPVYRKLREEKNLRDIYILVCVLMTACVILEITLWYTPSISTMTFVMEAVAGAISLGLGINQNGKLRQYKRARRAYVTLKDRLKVQNEAHARFEQLYMRHFTKGK